MLFALATAACGQDTSDAVTAAEDALAEDALAEDAMAEDNSTDDAAAETEDTGTEDAGAEDPGTEDTGAEDAGTEVRIVSLSPTATEMLFAVGAGDMVIAVDAFSYYPEEAPVTDLSGFEPNVEAISSYEPTVVYSQGPIEGLDALGIETVVLPPAATIDDVYTQIEQVGANTGNVAQAAELVLEMQTDIDAIVAALPARETPLTYYHEVSTTLYTATSNTFIGEVYRLLGLDNVADAADPDGEFFGFPQLNEEFLLVEDPDIIFLADTIFELQTAETVAARPGWDQLSAVQNGNVIEMNDDIASRWGPRIVEFLEVAGDAVAAIEAVPAS